MKRIEIGDNLSIVLIILMISSIAIVLDSGWLLILFIILFLI